MRTFTPLSEVAFPLQSGDIFTHRLLRGGEPYLVSETVASTFERRIQAGQIEGFLRAVPDRPVSADSLSVLVLFVGEFGDAVCFGPNLAGSNGSDRCPIDFVTAMGDQCLFPRLRDASKGHRPPATLDYPVSLRQANGYQSWVECDTRAHPHNRELPDVIAEAMAWPNEEGAGLTRPEIDLGLARALGGTLCPGLRKPRIGIVLKCGSHYRSWQGRHAWHTMNLLKAEGCNCYIIGPASKRVVFKVDGVAQEVWGDCIYDTSGLLTNPREYVAFLSCMDVVVAPDGGMLQLACALGKPTVGIFGPTSGKYRSKYAPRLSWIDGALDCAPCYCVGDHPPCEGKWCDAMLSIDPGAVVDKAMKAIGE